MAAHIAAGIKHPDNMTRKEKLQMIAALPTRQEAISWWLRHGSGISKQAANTVRKD